MESRPRMTSLLDENTPCRAKENGLSCVGIIANPQSGKDIRRLVALASSFSNHEKLLILRRVFAGLKAAGVDEILAFDDAGALGASALEASRDGSRGKKGRMRLIDVGARGEAEDSTRAAARMREEGAACIVVLGGDGTSRAVAKGSGKCPLVPLSTGTNNAFPQNWEGTVAGLGAGLYAEKPRRYAGQVMESKRLTARFQDEFEIALVDVALVNDSFAASRAVWDIGRIESLALTRCQPGGLGLSALGASLDPIGPEEPEGLWIEFGNTEIRNKTRKKGKKVLSPIGPGLVASADVRACRRIAQNEVVEIMARSGQVLAFDGERERVLSPGEKIEVCLDFKGPRVLHIPGVLKRAATTGHLREPGLNGLRRK